MQYLDFTDKKEILRAFQNCSDLLIVKLENILQFGDYSLEVMRCRRDFSTVFTKLCQIHIQFLLAYPVLLKVK